MQENHGVIPRNHALRVLLKLVDDNCTNLGRVLALLVGEAASDLECLSTSHDAFDCTHDMCIFSAPFVVLDDSGLGIVKSLRRTSVIAVGEEEKIVITLTLRRVLVRPFSYILHVHLSAKTQCCKPRGTHDSGRRSIKPSPPLF